MIHADLGEIASVDVKYSPEDVIAAISTDELWEIVEEDGLYVTIDYSVYISSDNESNTVDHEEEVFIDKEDAIIALQEEMDSLRKQLNNARVREADTVNRILELQRPCTVSAVSDATKALMGQGS